MGLDGDLDRFTVSPHAPCVGAADAALARLRPQPLGEIKGPSPQLLSRAHTPAVVCPTRVPPVGVDSYG